MTGKRAKRPYIRVTRWRRRRFFALLEESGNVRMAAELSGLGLGAIYRLRRVEPGFTERMAAAREVASARLACFDESGAGCDRLDSPSPNLSPEGRGMLSQIPGSSSGAGSAGASG